MPADYIILREYLASVNVLVMIYDLVRLLYDFQEIIYDICMTTLKSYKSFLTYVITKNHIWLNKITKNHIWPSMDSKSVV